VNIIGVRVSDKYGTSYTSDVIDGLEWVIKNKATYNIRVVNMSLSSAVAEPHTTSVLDAAVELTWLSGIVVVVAAGNLGPNTMLYPPANDPYAIVVGATWDKGTASTADDELAWFSSYGTTQTGVALPNLVAPGRYLYSTLASTSATYARKYPDRVTADGLYVRMSGTSMAAPVVSGVAALVLEARPGLKPDEVKWLLINTARPAGGCAPSAACGAGYPDAVAAVNYTGTVGRANQNNVPNNLVNAAAQSLGGASWNSLAWDSLAWDSLAWDSLAWDSLAWDSTTQWEAVEWELSEVE